MSLIFPVGEFRFVPLVTQRLNLFCHLETGSALLVLAMVTALLAPRQVGAQAGVTLRYYYPVAVSGPLNAHDWDGQGLQRFAPSTAPQVHKRPTDRSASASQAGGTAGRERWRNCGRA